MYVWRETTTLCLMICCCCGLIFAVKELVVGDTSTLFTVSTHTKHRIGVDYFFSLVKLRRG